MKIAASYLLRLALMLVALHASSQETTTSTAARGAAEPVTRLKETLVQLEQDSWRAWKARDPEFFKSFLSDDHVEIGAWGSADKTAVLASVASPRCVVTSYEVDRFRLTVISADTALLTYHARQDTRCNGVAVPSPAWASSLYARRGERWVNVLYQQTPATK